MTISTTATFGSLLRQYRLAATLSQEALAERAGLSCDAVRALEAGRRRAPRPGTVILLAEALGLAPPERESLIGAALGHTIPEESSSAASPAADPPVQSHLPPAPTPLIGREREQVEVAGQLRAGVRLLTLTGPGGVGKTRLAIAVASSLQHSYRQGVAFVDLSPLDDPDLVPATIANTLGLRATGTRDARELLLAYLASRHMLLVLDNVERVVDAAPLAAQLLSCPDLVVLVTSRVPLRVRAEQQYRVPPLATPSPHASPDQIAQVAAVQLFVARAQALQPAFQLDATNAGAVAQICARLDGLPLALELAAGRIGLLPPPALLRRLERRLAVLTRGPHDLPERQRGLRDTIAWSVDLLGEPARQLFARLAVFQGGRSLDAIEAVCNPDGTLDVLADTLALTEASLLQREESVVGEPRLFMLETVYEFAREQLDAGDMAPALRRLHAEYYVFLAERAAPALSGSDPGPWLNRLELEVYNLRAALQWAVEEREVELGLRLAAALWRFWQLHGYLSEGRSWLDRLLSMADSGSVDPSTRARALAGAGWLAHRQNDFARAATLLEESLAVHRATDNQAGIADVLINRGLVAHAQGDYARASALLDEALALRRASGDRPGIGGVLFRLGIITREQGRYERASELYEECLALHRELGDREKVAVALLGLGDIARDTGDYGRAEEMCRQSLAIFQELGDRWGIGCSLHNLGVAAAQEGNYAQAIDLIASSLGLFRELTIGGSVAEALVSLGRVWRLAGETERARPLIAEGLRVASAEGPRWLVAAALEETAALAVADGLPMQARHCLDAAGALRTTMGAPQWPANRADCERTLRAIEQTCDAGSAGSLAGDEAQTLPLEQAVADVLGCEALSDLSLT